MTDVLHTAVGPATVLHRLALAIECRDALSDRPTGTPVSVRYRRQPIVSSPAPPWKPLRRNGSAFFTLRHHIPDDPVRPLPRLEIAVDDPSRRYVPRRFTVTPWTYADVQEPATVAVRARLLRIWLLPGSAYAFPGVRTLVRGRVAHGDVPVRWARIEATTPTSVAGWAHADDRGEFVLPVVDPGFDAARNPTPRFTVELSVTAVRAPRRPEPGDRAADLISEPVTRPANPPTDADLDNDVLRGISVPPGYAANRVVVPPVQVPIGVALALPTDVDFVPAP